MLFIVNMRNLIFRQFIHGSGDGLERQRRILLLQRRAQPGHQHHLVLRLPPEQPDFVNPRGHFLSLWERTEVRVLLRYTLAACRT